MSEGAWSPRPQVVAWLQPLDGAACGQDLEYDPVMLELLQVAAGKPETQFSAAEPPAWTQVVSLCEDLLGRTRDLRVAMLWVRAMLSTEGAATLPEGLTLLRGLIDNFWDGLHPQLDPDDGDSFARINAISSLATLDGVLGDLRQALLAPDRHLAGMRVRDVEIALDKLAPRADDQPRTLAQIKGQLAEVDATGQRLRIACEAAGAELKGLQRVMNDRFGIERAVDVKPMRSIIEALQSVMPPPPPPPAEAQPEDQEAPMSDDAAAEESPRPRRGSSSGGLDRIETRQDALKALQAICAYLERYEPTNPAQLLLRRAERMMERNFLQLVRDLAPDALDQVARIMGVDPGSIGDD
ncbi:MAG TPA: type VI secretion system protein TssA [Rubrivivax sp.]|nr:type VI secretion system protein TssA [Rubrivivax sp.]